MEAIRDRRPSQQEARESSVLLGIIGSILGGFVGCIPWILIALAGYVASLGGMLISFLAYYGYKLFRGKTDRISTVITVNVLTVIVMTFIATLLGECTIFYRDAVKDGYEVVIPALLNFAFSLPFDAELAAESGIWTSLAMSYMYAGIGAAFVLTSVAKKHKQAKVPSFSQIEEAVESQEKNGR
ncbi:MAG TPA: hypothetical protein VN512_01130 [Clostridia bacterium]|nr:hypothetical protein [Clostridia bacterium]